MVKRFFSRSVLNILGSIILLGLLAKPIQAKTASLADLSSQRVDPSIAPTAIINTLSLAAYDQGYYRSDGYHNPSVTDYAVGYDSVNSLYYRNFFVFDLSGFAGTTYAALRIYEPANGYGSIDPSETWEVYEVSTPIAALINGTGGTAAYNDLGDGAGFGSATVTSDAGGSWIEVPLNAAGVTAINAAAGGSFAIGGALTTIDGKNVYVFGNSAGYYAQLIVKPFYTETFCSAPSLGIPDPGEASDALSIPKSGFILDVNLMLDVTHPWVGDLGFYLNHNGVDVAALDRPGFPGSPTGCSGDNLPGILLDDDPGGAPGTPVEDSCVNTTPAYTPGGSYTPNNPLNVLDGGELSGVWTLTASDNVLGNSGVLNNWCVEVTYLNKPVTVDDGGTTVFHEDFESGYANWSMDGLWNPENQAAPCGDLVDPFPSPTNAAYFGQDGICTYDVAGAATGSLTLNTPLPLSPAGTPRLSFSSYEQTQNSCSTSDFRYVEVSADNGGTWSTLGNLCTENTWHQVSFDLSAYAGQSVLLRFRFDSVNGEADNFFGWMVDDITLTGIANSEYLTDEDTSFITGNVLSNDSDPEGGSLHVAGFDATGMLGSLTNNGDGTFNYDPTGHFDWLAPGALAIESFTYIASDGFMTDTAMVTLTVSGLNEPPQVDILSAGPFFDSLAAEITISDTESDPIHGSVAVVVSNSPTAIILETLSTHCGNGGASPLQLQLNGGWVGETYAPGNCRCDPGIQTINFSGPEIAANYIPGNPNTWTFTQPKAGEPWTAWSRITVYYPGGSTQTACLFDQTGSGCTTSNACAGNSLGPISAAYTLPTLDVVRASVSYANSVLPESMDISAVPAGSYVLYADAFDAFGFNFDVEPIIVGGESTLIINPTPPVAVDDADGSPPKWRLFTMDSADPNHAVELDPNTGLEINRLALPEQASSGPNGLAFDGYSLWYINGYGTDLLYELDPDTGAVRDADHISAGSGDYDGLAYADGLVYIQDFTRADIHVFDPVSDTVVRTLDVNAQNGVNPVGGLAGIRNPTALIFTSAYGVVYELNPATGLVTHSFTPVTHGSYHGAAVLDGQIYLDNQLNGKIEVFTRSGAWVRSFNAFLSYALGGDDLLANGFITDEDTPINTRSVLVNDWDPDGDLLHVAGFDPGSLAGLLTDNGNGTFHFNPNGQFDWLSPGEVITETFSYVVSDGYLTDTATVFITIIGVNDPPIAVADAYTTPEDNPLSVTAPGVLSNDIDLEGDLLTASLNSGPAHGLLSLNPDGSFIYAPALNYNGIDSFTYTANDGLDPSPVATVTLTITPMPDPDLMITMSESSDPAYVGAPLTYTLTVTNIGDLAATGVILTDNLPEEVTFVSATPSQGVCSAIDGVVTCYEPGKLLTNPGAETGKLIEDNNVASMSLAPGEGFTVNILVDVVAPGILTNTAEVTLNESDPNPLDNTVTVTTVVPAPGLSLSNSVSPDVSVANHGIVTYTLVLVNSSLSTDPDVVLTDALPAEVDFADWIVQPAGASVAADVITWNGSLDGIGSITFVFTSLHVGSYEDVVTNTVYFSGLVNEGSATAVFTVEPNYPPVLAAIGDQVVDELTTLAFTAHAADDNLNDALTFSLDVGSVGSITPDGSFTWTPDEADGPGVYPVTVRVSDGALDDFETFDITVGEVNLAPIAVDDAYTTTEDTVLVVAAPGVLSNDSDPDLPAQTLNAEVSTPPATGVLFLTADGSFVYIPTLNFNGTLTFTYVTNDGVVDSAPAEVTITVVSVNDPPVVNAGENQTVNEGQSVQFAGSYTDPGLFTTQAATITWSFGDGLTASGTLTPTHTYADDGIYTVVLEVDDGEGGIASDTLLVIVKNVAPDLALIPDQSTSVNQILSITATYTDPGLLDTMQVLIDWGDGLNDNLELGAGLASFEMVHAFTVVGTYTVTVTLTDDDGGMAQVTFVVTVAQSGYTTWLPFIAKNSGGTP